MRCDICGKIIEGYEPKISVNPIEDTRRMEISEETIQRCVQEREEMIHKVLEEEEAKALQEIIQLTVCSACCEKYGF